jgi:hypothetical protein
LVIVRIVPKGSVGCAAVKSAELKISPEAVGLPSNSPPYQEAIPSWVKSSKPGACAVENTVIPAAINRIIINLFIFSVSAQENES